jgi:hypothetical protein
MFYILCTRSIFHALILCIHSLAGTVGFAYMRDLGGTCSTCFSFCSLYKDQTLYCSITFYDFGLCLAVTPQWEANLQSVMYHLMLSTWNIRGLFFLGYAGSILFMLFLVWGLTNQLINVLISLLLPWLRCCGNFNYKKLIRLFFCFQIFQSCFIWICDLDNN